MTAIFHLIVPFFCLASGISANKLIYMHIGPLIFTAFRMLISGIMLIGLLWWRTGKAGIKNLLERVWRDIAYLLIITCLTTLVQSLLKAYALANTLSSKVALIGSLDPFITAIICYLFWSEKLRWQQWLGIAIGFIGSTILIIGKTDNLYSEQLLGIVSYAEIAALASFILSRLGWMQIQKLLKHNRYTSEEINAITMTWGGIGGMIVATALEPMDWCSTIVWDWYLIGLCCYTIVIGNLVGYNLYAHALKRYSSPLIAIIGLTLPVQVYLFGVLFIGEPLYGNFIISLACISIALFLFYRHEGQFSRTLQR